MSTRGGTRRELFAAIQERDAKIGELLARIAKLESMLNGDAKRFKSPASVVSASPTEEEKP